MAPDRIVGERGFQLPLQHHRQLVQQPADVLLQARRIDHSRPEEAGERQPPEPFHDRTDDGRIRHRRVRGSVGRGVGHDRLENRGSPALNLGLASETL